MTDAHVKKCAEIFKELGFTSPLTVTKEDINRKVYDITLKSRDPEFKRRVSRLLDTPLVKGDCAESIKQVLKIMQADIEHRQELKSRAKTFIQNDDTSKRRKGTAPPRPKLKRSARDSDEETASTDHEYSNKRSKKQKASSSQGLPAPSRSSPLPSRDPVADHQIFQNYITLSQSTALKNSSIFN